MITNMQQLSHNGINSKKKQNSQWSSVKSSMNNCQPDRMAFKLSTWEDAFQVKLAWWLSSLSDGCQACVMAVMCDGWQGSTMIVKPLWWCWALTMKFKISWRVLSSWLASLSDSCWACAMAWAWWACAKVAELACCCWAHGLQHSLMVVNLVPWC